MASRITLPLMKKFGDLLKERLKEKDVEIHHVSFRDGSITLGFVIPMSMSIDVVSRMASRTGELLNILTEICRELKIADCLRHNYTMFTQTRETNLVPKEVLAVQFDISESKDLDGAFGALLSSKAFTSLM